MDILDQKYVSSILRYMLDHENIKKDDLRHIVKTVSTLDKTLNLLQIEGYIEIKEQILGRRVYAISLTNQGRAIAEQLKNIEEPSNSSRFLSQKEQEALLFLSSKNDIDSKEFIEKFSYSSISKLSDLKLIKQIIDTKAYPPKNFIEITDKGKKISKKLKEIEEILKE
ncbi:MAG: hypothetical protein ACP5U0_08845 [Caldisphaera sp.]